MTFRRNVIYARLSREDDRQPGTTDEKLAAQVGTCRRLAEQYGIPVHEEVIETASGGDLRKRPGMREILKDAREGKIGTLFATFADRLSRLEGREQLDFEEALSDGNVTVITTTGITKYGHDEESLPREVLALAAAYERRAFSRRVKSRNKEKLQENKRTGGSTGYGYRRDRAAPGGYSLRPEEYPVLVRILQGILAGRSEYSLCKEFEAEGIPSPGHRHTRQVGRWSSTTVMRIALNPFYAGRHAQRTRLIKRGGKKKLLHLPIDEYVISPVEGDWIHPLTWEEYCRIREKFQERYTPLPRCGLLTGILCCQDGGKMVRMGVERYQCYCHHQGTPRRTVKRVLVEEAAVRAVEYVFNHLPLDAFGTTEPERPRADLYSEHAKAQRAARDAFDALDELARRAAFFTGLMGEAPYAESLRRASLTHNAARAEEARLAALLAEPEPGEILPHLAVVRAAGFRRMWDELCEDARKKVVRDVIARIDLAPKPEGRTRHRPPVVTLAGWVGKLGVTLPEVY